MQRTFSIELKYIQRAPTFLYPLLQASRSIDLGVMLTLEGVSQKKFILLYLTEKCSLTSVYYIFFYFSIQIVSSKYRFHKLFYIYRCDTIIMAHYSDHVPVGIGGIKHHDYHHCAFSQNMKRQSFRKQTQSHKRG